MNRAIFLAGVLLLVCSVGLSNQAVLERLVNILREEVEREKAVETQQALAARSYNDVSKRGNSVTEALVYDQILYVMLLDPSSASSGSSSTFNMVLYDTASQKKETTLEDVAFKSGYVEVQRGLKPGTVYVLNTCRQGDDEDNCDVHVCPAKTTQSFNCDKKVDYCDDTSGKYGDNSWVCGEISQNSLVRSLRRLLQ